MDITAVVVTYNPPPEFLEHVSVWMSQVDHLIVVDNGSGPAWRDVLYPAVQKKFTNVEFLFNQENLGIAASLNRGFGRLIERGMEFAFVFDQDSRPQPGMVAEIVELYHHHPDRGRIAIVAPNVQIPSANTGSSFLQPRGRFLYRRVRCGNQRWLDDISIVISSGALYDLKVYQQIGPFRDDFFIDYVDTEYCLRAKQRGYNIVVACQAQLNHQLGNQQEKRFGPITMHPTFHSPLRWYYISRNRVPMFLSYALRFPHWLLYDLVVNSYGLVRLVLFEDQKPAKLLAIILGTWDGLANRMGPISRVRRSVFLRHEADARETVA